MTRPTPAPASVGVSGEAPGLFGPLALLLVIQVLVLEPAREVEAPAAVEASVQATGATP